MIGEKVFSLGAEKAGVSFVLRSIPGFEGVIPSPRADDKSGFLRSGDPSPPLPRPVSIYQGTMGKPKTRTQ